LQSDDVSGVKNALNIMTSHILLHTRLVFNFVIVLPWLDDFANHYF